MVNHILQWPLFIICPFCAIWSTSCLLRNEPSSHKDWGFVRPCWSSHIRLFQKEIKKLQDLVVVKFLPAGMPNGLPVITSGNGNCMFCSVPTLFRRDEGVSWSFTFELILICHSCATCCRNIAERVSKNCSFALGSCLSIFFFLSGKREHYPSRSFHQLRLWY